MARSDTAMPATGTMMVPAGQLTPHPDNPRGDLDLNPGFVGSFAESGVLVPLRITTRDDGDGYWIIDGARRHAAAVKAGLSEVPGHLVADRAGDLAGQYLDMVTTSKQRVQLKPAGQAAALSAARQAGAPKARMRKATGLTSQDITDAVTAGAMSPATRTQMAAAGRDLTLHELAILAGFDADQTAVTRLTGAAHDGRLEHEAELLREERREQAGQARLRAELDAAGITITEQLPPGAQLIYELSHDGAELTPESHSPIPPATGTPRGGRGHLPPPPAGRTATRSRTQPSRPRIARHRTATGTRGGWSSKGTGPGRRPPRYGTGGSPRCSAGKPRHPKRPGSPPGSWCG